MSKRCGCVAFVCLALFCYKAAAQHTTGLTFLSPEDYRKIPVADRPVAGPLPKIATLEWYFPKPGNQGAKPSCFAWATTYNKAYRIFDSSGRQGSPNDYLQSPAYVFSAMTGNQCNRGGYLPPTFAFLTRYGSLAWDDMPYDENTCSDWKNGITKAHNNSTTTLRLGSQADGIINEIRDHIAGQDPVIAGIDACEDFQNPVEGQIKEAAGTHCDGHAVLIVGYNDLFMGGIGAVRILNSWGTDWGDGGKVWMSYPALLKRLHEAYVDRGPDVNPLGSNFLVTTVGDSPDKLGAIPTVSPEVLLHALRLSVDSHVLRRFRDLEGDEKVSEWSIWLNLPRGYQLQIASTAYEFHHETFHHPVRSKPGSSIFLGTWQGFGCVDSATVTATLHDGSTVKADFNMCELLKAQVPKELWPPAN